MDFRILRVNLVLISSKRIHKYFIKLIILIFIKTIVLIMSDLKTMIASTPSQLKISIFMSVIVNGFHDPFAIEIGLAAMFTTKKILLSH